jgi:hypothetical protein
MYVINNMDFYVKISDAVKDELNTAKKVEYVAMTAATQFDSISDAAAAAEEMAIFGFDIVKYKSKN